MKEFKSVEVILLCIVGVSAESSVVSGVSRATIITKCTWNHMTKCGEPVAWGLRRTVHFATLNGRGRAACTERGWVSSTL